VNWNGQIVVGSVNLVTRCNDGRESCCGCTGLEFGGLPG
jgi:hypothetical protein